MTLRSPIVVNDQKIGEVEITRTFTDITHPGVHRYVWYLRTWTEDGPLWGCAVVECGGELWRSYCVSASPRRESLGTFEGAVTCRDWTFCLMGR